MAIRLPDEQDVEYAKKQIIDRKKTIAIVGSVFILVLVFFTTDLYSYAKIIAQPTDKPELCPLHDPIVPRSYIKDNSTILTILHDESFRLQSVQKLAQAVQVDTQIGDDQPDVDEAPELWEQFKGFHAYLEKTFPTIYSQLEVEYVNTYGLIFTWRGINTGLKPVLLTAHQDVVPVQKDTLDAWIYPPFSGHYDGKFIYGRGASDCKNVLVAILESIELLIENGFTPSRTVIAAFGFDEEASGRRGAYHIGKHLEKKLGKDSIYALLDEGPGLTIDPITGQIIASPATGEKGYTDIIVELTTPGGHSSVPPDHTSIGIISELGYFIEKDQYSPIFTSKNPLLQYLQCVAVNSDKVPTLTKKAILRAGFDKFANSKIVENLSKNPLTKYLIQTSQAIDIIRGGEKANALPENVKLTVNHRISVETSSDQIHEHFTNRVIEVAKRHGFSVVSFGKEVFKGDGKSGTFVISSPQTLESAPVSPADDTVWKYLAATTRHVFEDAVFTNLSYPIIVAPVVMPANTDTRHYWSLTRNIYRFSPFFETDFKDNNIHSVNEKLEVDAHLQLLAFFYEYIQNVDSSKADN